MNSAVPNPKAFLKLMAPTPAERRIFTAMRAGMRVLSWVAPGLAARVCLLLFTLPRRYTPPRFEQEIAATAEDLHFAWAGRELRAYAWGAGPVVLLVHGWEGRGAQLGRFMEPLVAAGYRVVALDAPAHGRSDGRRTEAVEFARALPEVVDQLGGVHAIVAHSYGAGATVMAIQRGLVVEKVVLIGMPDRLMHVIARFQFMMGVSDRVIARFLRLMEKRSGTRPEDVNMVEMDPSGVAACLHIHDRGDIEVPYVEGEAIMRAWPNAKHVATSGLGHRRILKDGRVAAMVTAFVQGEDVDDAVAIEVAETAQ
ncbi:MAG: alpha/beta hydrolase [Candidatus Hydrogenedentes bacterium]|nr:alpha/beta hydrolase [Candidatus Hydrogenedentota bacterium]